MPKKTKKMKIRSALRRIQTPLISKATHQQTSVTSDISLPHLSSQIPSNQSVSTVNADDLRITAFFKQDLKKSFLLILGIITLEIFFYFASMSTALKGFLPF